MLIKISGLDVLDGEYELDPQPNLNEITAFRKAAGLTPSEMADSLSNGGLEVLPLYVFTALQRNGRSDLASLIVEIPVDKWGGFAMSDDEADEEEADLPPASALVGPDSASATD